MLPAGRHFVGWIRGDEAQDEDPMGSPAQVVRWPAMNSCPVNLQSVARVLHQLCLQDQGGRLSQE
jgi:hypothetical protein